MARTPSFQLNDTTFAAPMVKVSREKLYGWTNKNYLDTHGNPCQFVSLLDDGKTMIGSGCTAFKSFDDAGNEVSRSAFVAQNDAGDTLEKHPSVFSQINQLSTDKTLQDYLNMSVKSLYQINTDELENRQHLLAELKQHKVLYFPFSYSAGYDPDDAFMLASGEHVFIVVGNMIDFTYARLDEAVELEDEAEDADDTDDIDFSMF